MGKQIIINACISIVYFCQITSFNMLGCDSILKKEKRRKEIVKLSEYMPTSKYATYLGYISVHYKVRSVSSCEQEK